MHALETQEKRQTHPLALMRQDKQLNQTGRIYNIQDQTNNKCANKQTTGELNKNYTD